MDRTLLIVDDESPVRAALRRTLMSPDYAIIEAVDAREALFVLARMPVDVVISDHHMPGATGTSFLAEVSASYPNIVRVLLTADASTTLFTAAISEANVRRVVYKPWDDAQLQAIVRQCLGLRPRRASRSPGRYEGVPTLPRMTRIGRQ